MYLLLKNAGLGTTYRMVMSFFGVPFEEIIILISFISYFLVTSLFNTQITIYMPKAAAAATIPASAETE